MKAVPWQLICCIATADVVIASSMPQPRGSCCFLTAAAV